MAFFPSLFLSVGGVRSWVWVHNEQRLTPSRSTPRDIGAQTGTCVAFHSPFPCASFLLDLRRSGECQRIRRTTHPHRQVPWISNPSVLNFTLPASIPKIHAQRLDLSLSLFVVHFLHLSEDVYTPRTPPPLSLKTKRKRAKHAVDCACPVYPECTLFHSFFPFFPSCTADDSFGFLCSLCVVCA